MKLVYYDNSDELVSFYNERGQLVGFPTLRIKCSTDPWSHRSKYFFIKGKETIYEGTKYMCKKKLQQELENITSTEGFQFEKRSLWR